MTAAGESWRFEAIGTTWRIDTPHALGEERRARVSGIIDAFDREWSRFREDSVVASLARHGGSALAPADAGAMFDAYRALAAHTDGAVNPLIGAALSHRGYDPSLTLRDRGALAAPARWDDIVSWYGGTLTVRSPVTIDVGALGKGRLVDLVLDALRDVPGDIVVDASGDLAVRGSPQRIGLEHPFDAQSVIGVWTVTDAALCASATNRRAWGDGLHHVLDARTGEPVDTVAATWAVASDAMHADGAATALFFDGGPRLAHSWGVQWVRMFTDGRVQWSPDCAAELFTAR